MSRSWLGPCSVLSTVRAVAACVEKVGEDALGAVFAKTAFECGFLIAVAAVFALGARWTTAAVASECLSSSL